MKLSEIVKQLNWRSAIKSFDPDKKLSETELDQLLEVLRLSPSSYGLQPWKFVVVKDMEIRKKLQAAAHNQSQVVDASDFIVLCFKTFLGQSDVDRYISTMAEVRGVKEEDLEGFKKLLYGFISNKTSAETAIWSTNQTYIALGNLLTACAVAEIDACPMEGFDANKFNDILNLKDTGFSASVACAIGYRNSSDSGSQRKKVRFPKEEVVIKK